MKCCYAKCLALTLLVVGGLNWGLVGFFDFNLVERLLGSWPMAVTVVYDLVGLAAVVYLCDHFFCPCNKGEACAKKEGMGCGGNCKCGKK